MKNYINNTKKKVEILYGFHPVFESILAKKRKFYKIFIKSSSVKSSRTEKILEISKVLGIECSILKTSSLRLLSKYNYIHNFLAIVSPFSLVDFQYIMELTKNINSHLIVILDGILDPYNFGAIIRSAYCFGATGIIITKNRTCPPTPTVSKISAGAMEHLPICKVTNLSRTILKLKKNGFWIIGTDSKKISKNIINTKLSSPIAIIFGAEEKGIHNLVSKKCDIIVSIPIKKGFDSLNVSVAGGIFLYEISKKIKIFTTTTS